MRIFEIIPYSHRIIPRFFTIKIPEFQQKWIFQKDKFFSRIDFSKKWIFLENGLFLEMDFFSKMDFSQETNFPQKWIFLGIEIF